ncbi:general transcription factor 3C polypeptide 3 isoform X3 [Conger conger]|uniref:general transcription factor 3C polypeptide 3 isoform X1 n=1 Tax=Conger conger TaxID=82655 RepID=UPI002A5A8115|nr:general transcription factor 3C polypeptide 3 isoform X1 [Conger conger]XP_061082622.1 general transcription factor 3C polypeptide 3 isoform X2 [Conger conger]XP_061082623.1 general transcription factor 3C polypeptide 3 isoform X3 [Conger conger]
MSGFNPELIDYLEGKISFEEFEKQREERKSKEKATLGEEDGVPPDDPFPSTSSGTRRTRKRRTEGLEEGVSPGIHKAFSSMLQDEVEELIEDDDDDDDDEDDEDGDGGIEEEEEEEDEEGEVAVAAKEGEEQSDFPSAGDVFALEMELNRENKKMMRERRHRSKLPRALRGLMGEANIRYARGEKEDAITMCMEIIRQAPLAYEPFSTLAMIYEDLGDMEKSLQFGLIAAHLNPSDCEEWVKLADMSLEQDNIKQAILCYSKAIKYDSTNVRYLWERSTLYEQIGEHKQAMDGYRRLLSLLPPTDGEHFMQLSRDMAKSYYETSDLTAAIGVMEEALSRYPDLVTHESVNMAAELYIANHQHSQALQVLVQFCGIVMLRDQSKREPAGGPPDQAGETGPEKPEEGEKPQDELEGEVQSVQIPEHIPVDIRIKLMVCLIHQHMFKPLEPMLTALMEQSPEELGDLYLDVAEAFLDEGEYGSALPLLSALVCSERYNLAVVWLRHAECLKALGHMEVAVKSYIKVVEMAPLHLEARLTLSTLQQQLGHPEQALQALEPMHDPDTLAQDSAAAQQELKLLLHRSTLLNSQGRREDYIDTVLTMLAMFLKVAMNRAQVCLVSSSRSGEKRLYLVKVSCDKVSDIDDQEAAYLDVIGKTNVLSKEDWWQLLLRTIVVLCELHRYEEAELLVDSSLEYYSFYDDRVKRKELEYFGLSATILDRNFRTAYNYIRLKLMDNVDRPQLWNIFNQVTIHSQDVRHHRFCLRLLLKNPDNHALCVLNGHNGFVSGSFKHALGQYMQAFRSKPNEPLYSLCVGLTFFHMASQKFVIKRHPLLLQGFTFLTRYSELRGHSQESLYNIGRALHQLGLTHLAIHYYQKALNTPSPSLEGIEDDQVDLSREIAYNLSLIYQASGNKEMVRHLLYTYCSI